MTMAGDYETHVAPDDNEDILSNGRLFDVGDLPDDIGQRAVEMERWLSDLHERTADETVRKAIEYGSSDLELMGNAMLMLVPEPRRDRVLGLEMACGFYLLGKIARMFGAFEKGDKPSGDTIFDAMVYAQMMLKIRETGKWF